jgi:small subunit ribosomal protein S9
MPTAPTTVEIAAGDAAIGVIADVTRDAQAGAPADDGERAEFDYAELDSAEFESAEPDSAGYEGAESGEAGEFPAEYSTETPPEDHAGAEPAAARPALTGQASATGRRKEAIARVRITPGTGAWRINGHRLEEYFPNKVHQQLVNEPFVTLGAEGRFDLVALIRGGGVTGQAGALRLGIARALAEVDPDNRPALKKVGFLTRNARVKERKKYGLKKARKAPQYSKR